MFGDHFLIIQNQQYLILRISKTCRKHILQSLHDLFRYGVPYFKDTTPSWSTRGKLRQQLVPLLTDMYGDGFLRSLTNLAKESDDYQDLVENNIFKPFRE